MPEETEPRQGVSKHSSTFLCSTLFQKMKHSYREVYKSSKEQKETHSEGMVGNQKLGQEIGKGRDLELKEKRTRKCTAVVLGPGDTEKAPCLRAVSVGQGKSVCC